VSRSARNEWIHSPAARAISFVLRLAVAAGLLTFVLRRGVGRSLVELVVQSPWLPVLFTVQTLLGVVVEAERLRGLLGSFGVDLPRSRAGRVVTVGAFFNACIPGGTGGDLMKYFFLGGEALGRARLAAVLLVDRVIGLSSLLLAAVSAGLVGSLFAPYPPAAVWVLSLAALALLVLSLGLWLLWSRRAWATRWREALLDRLPFQRTVGAFARAMAELGDHPRVLAKAVALSVLGQTTLAVAFAAAGHQLMPQLPGVLVGGLGLLALVANVLPITPGGLGVGEVASSAIFRLAGVAGGSQLVLLWRIGAIPVIVAGGLLYGFGSVGGSGRRGDRTVRSRAEIGVAG
jgi:uncharacterized membrane protein YbhN (UPF0104 family)